MLPRRTRHPECAAGTEARLIRPAGGLSVPSPPSSGSSRRILPVPDHAPGQKSRPQLMRLRSPHNSDSSLSPSTRPSCHDRLWRKPGVEMEPVAIMTATQQSTLPMRPKMKTATRSSTQIPNGWATCFYLTSRRKPGPGARGVMHSLFFVALPGHRPAHRVLDGAEAPYYKIPMLFWISIWDHHLARRWW